MVKRVLKWPKHLSNTATITVFGCFKYERLNFGEEAGIPTKSDWKEIGWLSGRVVLALCDDIESMGLVRECRELEELFGTSYTDVIHSRSDYLK